MPPERTDPDRTHSLASGGITRQRQRVAGRALGSLLLGAAAILGAVVLFRQGVLPLIDAVFQPGPEWLVVFRRLGILLGAVAAYWAYVRFPASRTGARWRRSRAAMPDLTG